MKIIQYHVMGNIIRFIFRKTEDTIYCRQMIRAFRSNSIRREEKKNETSKISKKKQSPFLDSLELIQLTSEERKRKKCCILFFDSMNNFPVEWKHICHDESAINVEKLHFSLYSFIFANAF